MTDYHPVTKGLHCNHECVCRNPENCRPEQGCACEGCRHDTRIHPDPLALLEAWRKHERSVNDRSYYEAWILEYEFIKQLRTDPEAVLKELKEKGVWKE